MLALAGGVLGTPLSGPVLRLVLALAAWGFRDPCAVGQPAAVERANQSGRSGRGLLGRCSSHSHCFTGPGLQGCLWSSWRLRLCSWFGTQTWLGPLWLLGIPGIRVSLWSSVGGFGDGAPKIHSSAGFQSSVDHFLEPRIENFSKVALVYLIQKRSRVGFNPPACQG